MRNNIALERRVGLLNLFIIVKCPLIILQCGLQIAVIVRLFTVYERQIGLRLQLKQLVARLREHKNRSYPQYY